MSESAIEKLKQLDQERSALLSGAKSEALGRAKDAIAELRNLGFDYRLVEGKSGERGPRKGTRTVADKPCPICEFQTSPPHDARRHRAQGERKRPFTARQLEELGLAKVE